MNDHEVKKNKIQNKAPNMWMLFYPKKNNLEMSSFVLW